MNLRGFSLLEKISNTNIELISLIKLHLVSRDSMSRVLFLLFFNKQKYLFIHIFFNKLPGVHLNDNA